jgi:putative ABC transport system ATP-binding protein
VTSYTSRFVYLKDGYIESVTERGNMTQEEYFHAIVEVNSAESREVLAE